MILIPSSPAVEFREKLKYFVETVVQKYQPLEVTRGSGEDFVVISA
ncbi:MAG: type II toxin-antitoxin system prevent-host-death family antitoxin [Cyanobacteria bacterium J06621_12]